MQVPRSWISCCGFMESINLRSLCLNMKQLNNYNFDVIRGDPPNEKILVIYIITTSLLFEL